MCPHRRQGYQQKLNVTEMSSERYRINVCLYAYYFVNAMLSGLIINGFPTPPEAARLSGGGGGCGREENEPWPALILFLFSQGHFFIFYFSLIAEGERIKKDLNSSNPSPVPVFIRSLYLLILRMLSVPYVAVEELL